jgi:DNA-binding protein YbaB
MFGNLFGDVQQKQADMAAKAAEITVETETSGIKVTANGAKEILNISITDPSVLNDKEQLEDILVGVINRALSEAGIQAAAEMEKMMASMLPPGFGDLLKGGFPQ